MKDFKNIKDTDFDKLFRESAEKSVPDFEESSWDKMAALLDDSEPAVDFNWKKPLTYSGLILLLLSISYVSYRGFSKDGAGEEIVLATSAAKSFSETKAFSKSIESQESKSINPKIQDVKHPKGVVDIEQSIGDKPIVAEYGSNDKRLKNQISSKAGIDKITAIDLETKSEKEIEELTNERKLSRSVLSTRNAIKEPLSNLAEGLTHTSSVNDLTESSQNPFNRERFRSEYVPLTKLSSNDYIPFEVNFEPVILTVPKNVVLEVLETESLPRGFILRLAFSPDLSFVPENSFFKIGHNWAALLEYRFNDRWSIQTGVIKSLKYYQAGSEQYQWSEKWGERPDELNRIDARCSMMDIPLNIRYDLSTQKNRWFAQAGFTNYLMLKENYDYIFANNYKEQVWKSWEGKTGFYPAGTVNLSVGLEKRFFKNVAVQIEPFFKVPIGKVGYGKVKLATTGLFISTKFPLKK